MISRFEIPGALPSMNEVIAKSKQHYAAYSNMKKKYTKLVKESATGLPKIGKSDFVITWHCKNKRADPDNLAAGAKFVFDGLVEAGVIENDGWANVNSVTHFFKVDKANPKVEVEIYEITAAENKKEPLISE